MLDDEFDFEDGVPSAQLAAWSLRAADQRRLRMTLRFEDAAGNADERGRSVSVLLPAEAALYLSAELGRQALAVDAGSQGRDDGGARKGLI